MIGLFIISRLITSPNPGTSSFPFGTEGVADVSVLLSCCDGKGDGDVVTAFVSADVLDAGDAAAGAGVISGGGAGAGGGGAGGAGGGGAIGLAGFTGLVTFVGLVMLFTHVFAVSTHEPGTGCP